MSHGVDTLALFRIYSLYSNNLWIFLRKFAEQVSMKLTNVTGASFKWDEGHIY